MSSDGSTLPGGRDPGARLMHLLEEIEGLPPVRSEARPQRRMDLIAEVEAIVRARRQIRDS